MSLDHISELPEVREYLDQHARLVYPESAYADLFNEADAALAAADREVGRLRAGGNCANHNGYKQDCNLDLSPCHTRSHCHFTPSRWAERSTS